MGFLQNCNALAQTSQKAVLQVSQALHRIQGSASWSRTPFCNGLANEVKERVLDVSGQYVLFIPTRISSPRKFAK
jgi:hypothetical protein